MMNDNFFSPANVAEVLDRTFRVFLARPDTFLTLALVSVAPSAYAIFTVLFVLGRTLFNTFYYGIPVTSWYYIEHGSLLLVTLLLVLFVSSVLPVAAGNAMIHVAADVYLGNNQRHQAATTAMWWYYLKVGFRTVFDVFLAEWAVAGFSFVGACGLVMACILLWQLGIDPSVVMMICVTICLFVLPASSFYVWSSTILVSPVILIEKKGPLQAINRSFDLTGGRLCYVIGAMVMLQIAFAVLSKVLEKVFTTNGGGDLFGLWNFSIIILQPALVFSPLWSIFRFVLYCSLRCQVQQGFSSSQLQTELHRARGPSDMVPLVAANNV